MVQVKEAQEMGADDPIALIVGSYSASAHLTQT